MRWFLILGAWALAAIGAAAADPVISQENFETETGARWQAGGGEAGGAGRAEVVAGAGRDASAALLWHYDLGAQPGGTIYSRCRPMWKLPGKPARLTLWIDGDGSNLALQFRVSDATGKVWQNGVTRIDWTGWREIEIPIAPTGYCWGGVDQPDKGFLFPVTLVEFMLDYSNAEAAELATRTSGTLRLDDLTVYENGIDIEEF